VFDDPFASAGRWYRANLHAHTTNSDGDLSPADCAEYYRDAGYDILALTDHWCVSEAADRPGLLIMPGVELDGGRPEQGGNYHIVGLNVRTRGKMTRPQDATARRLVDMIRDDLGEAFIAHPYWSGLMASDMANLEGCFAVEVYNTGCDLEILRGYSSVHWDDLLTLGHSFGAVAVDDGHHHRVDHGLAWTMIRAEELSVEAVMEALRHGRYYASTGPQILDLRVTDGHLRVATSPVASIALVSAPTQGGRVFAPEGETLTEAEFPLPPARYCRVEAMDANGKTAWSNPVVLGS
jgi:hypothetical protein